MFFSHFFRIIFWSLPELSDIQNHKPESKILTIFPSTFFTAERFVCFDFQISVYAYALRCAQLSRPLHVLTTERVTRWFDEHRPKPVRAWQALATEMSQFSHFRLQISQLKIPDYSVKRVKHNRESYVMEFPKIAKIKIRDWMLVKQIWTWIANMVRNILHTFTTYYNLFLIAASMTNWH